MKKILKILLIFIFSTFILFSIGIFYVIKEVNEKYPPELIDNYKPLTPSIIYDINGNQIDLITIENRDPINIKEIPKIVQDAFISVEDKRFKNHNGLDYIRLSKALFLNVTGRGKEGGSTITQQLIKTIFLTPDRSIKRKVIEAIMATRMERRLTKDEILELYLNTINFGRSSYGIKNAAKNYFGKLPKDLTIAEAAILASIPKSPTKYSKYENAIKRQKIVLKLMFENGVITREEYENSKNEEIKFIDLKNDNISENLSTTNIAPEFTTVIISKMKEILNIENEEDEKLLFNGYKIYSTVDVDIQKAAYKSFATNSNLQKNDLLQGALISIDPLNGYVKAMVGGKDFIKGNFNRALNSKRQPGSSFKPFIYLKALLDGYTMANSLEDSPTTFGSWSPKNYDHKFRNNITLLKALEISDNIIAIKTLENIGIKNFIKFLIEFDIKKEEIPNDLTISLGSITLSPIDLAKMYIPLANGGEIIEPHFIYKVENRFGEIIYEASKEKKRIFEPEYSALITHMMKSVVKNGGSKGANLFKNSTEIEVAGKTGTTSDYISAWFAGYIPNLVTVVYVGNDDNKSMGRGMSGASAALPIWKSFMQTVVNLPNYDIGNFEFIKKSLQDQTIIRLNIDAITGLIETNGENAREALFISGTEPIEYEDKIFDGYLDFEFLNNFKNNDE